VNSLLSNDSNLHLALANDSSKSACAAICYVLWLGVFQAGWSNLEDLGPWQMSVLSMADGS
jgi:hypothetical protein